MSALLSLGKYTNAVYYLQTDWQIIFSAQITTFTTWYRIVLRLNRRLLWFPLERLWPMLPPSRTKKHFLCHRYRSQFYKDRSEKITNEHPQSSPVTTATSAPRVRCTFLLRHLYTGQQQALPKQNGDLKALQCANSHPQEERGGVDVAKIFASLKLK